MELKIDNKINKPKSHLIKKIDKYSSKDILETILHPFFKSDFTTFLGKVTSIDILSKVIGSSDIMNDLPLLKSEKYRKSSTLGKKPVNRDLINLATIDMLFSSRSLFIYRILDLEEDVTDLSIILTLKIGLISKETTMTRYNEWVVFLIKLINLIRDGKKKSEILTMYLNSELTDSHPDLNLQDVLSHDEVINHYEKLITDLENKDK